MEDEEENYRYFGGPLRAAGAKEESSFRDAVAAGLRSEGLRPASGREEWRPQAFRSSRGDRATFAQRVQDFMDEDELEEYNGASLQVAGDYGALGARSQDVAQREARREAEARHPGLPVLLDDELVGTGSDSVGLRLLKQLGWYVGKRLGEFVSEKNHKSRFLAEALPGIVETASGKHGVGYEKGAASGLLRRGAASGPLATAGADSRRLAFGLSNVEGIEDGGIGGDLVQDDGFFVRGRGIDLEGHLAAQRGSLRRIALGDRLKQSGYSFEIDDGSDDDATPAIAAGPGAMTSLLESREAVQRKRDLVPSGFDPEVELFEFAPPTPITVPVGWLPRFDDLQRSATGPQSSIKAQPPENPELRERIDAAALQVARGGDAVERVLRSRRGMDPGWEFLVAGGKGHAYFHNKIRGLRSIEPEHPPEKPCASKAGPPSSLPASGPPALLHPSNVALGNSMLSKSVLGVVASDRASLLASLKTSFVRGELQGSAGDALAGLRPGTAPAEPTNERNLDTLPSRWVRAEDLSRVRDRRPEERIASAPSRTSRDWRPAPLLCKRLGVANPYHGRAPELQMSTARIDYVTLPATAQALDRRTPSRPEVGSREALPAVVDNDRHPSLSQLPPATVVQVVGDADSRASSAVPPLPSTDDAIAQADAFLASLAPELAPEGNDGGAEEDVAAVHEPSLDLFRAIFDFASSESEAEDAPAGGREAQGPAPSKTAGVSLFGLARLRAEGSPSVDAPSQVGRAWSSERVLGSKEANQRSRSSSPLHGKDDEDLSTSHRYSSHKRMRTTSSRVDHREGKELLRRRDSSDRRRHRDRSLERTRVRDRDGESSRGRSREGGSSRGRDRDAEQRYRRESESERKRDRDYGRDRDRERDSMRHRGRQSEHYRERHRERSSDRKKNEFPDRPSDSKRSEDRDRHSERKRGEDCHRPSGLKGVARRQEGDAERRSRYSSSSRRSDT